jgi:glyoxylase-like metal-dependent hydrolase (beta-lactamase superfamily II)/rhodanese-related sulfurtransferase
VDEMIFHQYFLGCLSHASYLVGDESTGRAVVVDPQRDVSGYLADADAAGLEIERVIETHFHADFLSGHLELAEATGASICFGEQAVAEFPIERLTDGQRLRLGDVEVEVRVTPGHTPESISLVVYEHADDEVPYGVLTGDTLFIGDVGRPDLLAAEGASAAELAGQLYRSLREQLLTLPDETRVFPAHGAGSACGKSLSSETSSTIGQQRRTNYALAPMDESDFVHIVTEGQPLTPLYFPYSAHRNRERRPLLDEHHRPAAISPAEILDHQARGAVVLDTREPAEFAAGHLRGSLNVGLTGRFAEYAGDVLRPDDAIILVCDSDHDLEATVRLGRIGFDNVIAAVADPVSAFMEHPELTEQSSRLTAVELVERLRDSPDLIPLDVRNAGEVAEGAIAASRNIPLASLLARLDEVDPHRPVIAYCASGYRSSIAASVLARAGYGDVSDLLGGFSAWRVLAEA